MSILEKVHVITLETDFSVCLERTKMYLGPSTVEIFY